MTSEARLITCIGVAHDLALLPHFLRHYRDLGIAPGRIHPILNAADGEAPGIAEAERILAEFGVAPAETWIAPYTSEAMWEKRRALQAALCGPSDWVISADVDELHRYPEPLPGFLDRCAELGVDCVQGPMIDRLATDGRLAPVVAAAPLDRQFPLRAEVALAISGSGAWHDHQGTVKVMACRPHVLPGRGGHRPWKGQRAAHLYRHPLGDFPEIRRPAFRFALPAQVDHYHWTAGLDERLRVRLSTPGVSKAGREYGQKQLDHFERHGGVGLAEVALAAGHGAGAPWPDSLHRLRRRGRVLAAAARIREAVPGLTP